MAKWKEVICDPGTRQAEVEALRRRVAELEDIIRKNEKASEKELGLLEDNFVAVRKKLDDVPRLVEKLTAAMSRGSCSGTGTHEFVASDSGPAAGYGDGVPYCMHCGEYLFDLTDRELRMIKRANNG